MAKFSIFVLFFLTANLSYSATANIKIIEWSTFFSATGRTFLQNGSLVDVKDLNFDLPSCSALGFDLDKDTYAGELSFSNKIANGRKTFFADFKYNGVNGEMLSLHCSSSVEIDLNSLNKSLSNVALIDEK